MTLTEFLLARIAEDEAVARAAVLPAHDGYKPHGELARWRYREDEEVEYDWDDPGPYHDVIRVTNDSEGLTPAVRKNCGTHIARFDPERILVECEAKRRIVEDFEILHADYRSMPDPTTEARRFQAQIAQARMAAVYADHPDYRDEWKP